MGTITEIYDYLRVLFARVGKGHCPECHRPITAQTREQIIDRIALLSVGTRFLVLAPLIRGQKGEYRDLFEDLLKQGFVRARVDGRVVRLTDDLRLDRQMRHNIEVVIDRLVAGPKIRSRLAEAVELALRLGEGNLVVAEEKDEGGRRKDEEDPIAVPSSFILHSSDLSLSPTTPARTAKRASNRPARSCSASTVPRACAPSAVGWGRFIRSIPSG